MIVLVVLPNLSAGVVLAVKLYGVWGAMGVLALAGLFLWARSVGNRRVTRWDQ